ncbi:CHAT domain-containing protein, partial [Microcoleus sp. PH2017_05_CCC_O_A]|uniref:CHAT domain-containing protein n=1 Tax=Microcoleus sp. PH2017_05_CCC_O_A TaxID=2798816 RepID=UPI0025EE21FB
PAPNSNLSLAPINQNPAPNSNLSLAPINQNPAPNSNLPIAPINQNPAPNSNLPIAPITQNPAPNSNLPIAPITQNPAPNSNLPIAPINQNPASNSNLSLAPTINQILPAPAPINLAPIPTPELAPAPSSNGLPSTNPLFSASLQQQNQISSSLQQPNSRRASPNIIDVSNLPVNPSAIIFPVENRFTRDFVDYLNLPPTNKRITLEESQKILRSVAEGTGMKPALVYMSFVPNGSTFDRPYNSSPLLRVEQQIKSSDELEVMVIAPDSAPFRVRIAGTSRAEVMETIRKFRNELTNPVKRNTKTYLPFAQQLYQWMIAPIEAELQAKGIQNLSFIADMGLRSIPMAALHDGKGFLIERYSVGSMPSLSLTDTSTTKLPNTQVLAMGASQFPNMSPLPAVEIEVSTIIPQESPGKSFLNQAFTLANLKSQRQQYPFGRIHLATHAEFRSGNPSESFIQLWDTKLRLNQLRDMGWGSPQVDMLVLSACRTAVGDRESELGFGGLAVQAGVKSALATLWYVSDEGSLGLMADFYGQLKTAPMKAEALRQAQLEMLRQQVRIEGGILRTSVGNVQLPPEMTKTGTRNFSHPYYWAAFRMIGNPW